MMSAVATVTTTDVAAAIRAEHEAAQHDHLSAVQHAIRCGELLLQAKAGMAHGVWEKWIDANCRFAHRTAQGYMRLAKLDHSKAQRVADLSLRQALKDIGEEFGRKQKRIERQVARDLSAEREPIVHDAVAVRVDDVPAQPARPPLVRVAADTPKTRATKPTKLDNLIAEVTKLSTADINIVIKRIILDHLGPQAYIELIADIDAAFRMRLT